MFTIFNNNNMINKSISLSCISIFIISFFLAKSFQSIFILLCLFLSFYLFDDFYEFRLKRKQKKKQSKHKAKLVFHFFLFVSFSFFENSPFLL